ncbi:hypothetical protein P7C73_g5466, partial [Tremellales sp. Uapishka_1]
MQPPPPPTAKSKKRIGDPVTGKGNYFMDQWSGRLDTIPHEKGICGCAHFCNGFDRIVTWETFAHHIIRAPIPSPVYRPSPYGRPSLAPPITPRTHRVPSLRSLSSRGRSPSGPLSGSTHATGFSLLANQSQLEPSPASHTSASSLSFPPAGPSRAGPALDLDAIESQSSAVGVDKPHDHSTTDDPTDNGPATDGLPDIKPAADEVSDIKPAAIKAPVGTSPFPLSSPPPKSKGKVKAMLINSEFNDEPVFVGKKLARSDIKPAADQLADIKPADDELVDIKPVDDEE